MSKYNWALASRSTSHVQHMPLNPPQIACRLCDQIFVGSRALMHHLESHMTENNGIVPKRQQQQIRSHQREGNDSILSLPIPAQELRRPPAQNPAVAAGNHISAARFDIPPPQLPISRSNYPLIRPRPLPSVQPAKQRVTTNLFHCDFIKPYIDLLDKPIPQIVELMESDDDEKLDLTLKL